jgi:dipeptidyl aminopeptidase/acylaminoacyl peptidase
VFFTVLAFIAAELAWAQPAAPAKRPLTHADYDGWKTIQQPALSRDGHYLAYNLLPADGDGEFVVRDLVTGGEQRLPRGRGTPAPAKGTASKAAAKKEYADEDQKRAATVASKGPTTPAADNFSQLAGAVHQFRPDSKSVVFSLIHTKAEMDKARADKKANQDLPRAVVAVMDLASGKITAKLEGVASFTVSGDGPGFLLYRRQAKPADKKETAKDNKEAKTPDKKDNAAPAPQPAYGTDLVLRDLASGTERTFADVTEHVVTRDGKTLVYAVSSKAQENNGVYAVQPLPGGDVLPLLSGKGRYQKLTWDEKQTQLVFFSDKADAVNGRLAEGEPSETKDSPGPTAKPKMRIYHWDPKAGAQLLGAGGADIAVDLLGPTPPGIRAGWSISDRGSLSFSPDGTRLYVGTSPERQAEKIDRPAPSTAQAASPGEDAKAAFDLWHYKDAYIQPMQKARLNQEQNKTYRAVYFLKEKTFRQLSDEATEVAPAGAGDFALGTDNRKYRHLTGYGPELSDYAVVNVRTGEQKPLLTGWHWAPTFAPDGRSLLAFDGKDWLVTSVADGHQINLTAKLPVKFVQEEWDQPSEPGPYGLTGWSADSQFVLLNDRYDIWRIAADGSASTLLTAGQGRKTNTVLRFVPPPRDDRQPPNPGIDLAKPLLFKAVNKSTYDEGFYRLEPGGTELKLLLMGARSYGTPVKARDADSYLMTVSTFYDAPDWYQTNADFSELKRVTDANPKKAELVWGKAELVRFKNLDGVELAGVLVKPEDFDPQKKYPMIVYIYERLSQNLHHFVPPSAGTSINPTFYASNGYLVFMPDIVYTVGAPGQSALKCVLPGIQAVVDRGYVDEKAIGIQGHSWGGYQIAYLVTQTTRFKAAAAGAPVSNMVSAYDGIRWGTGLPRQFQYERTQSRIGASLWQAPQKFIENSPIFMADRVRTPLLMLHNDRDGAVPWYQGIEYYLALRRLGKECYLFNYIGEDHGLAKKANQRDYTLRMQQFFDHHLKGTPRPEWMEKGIPHTPRDGERPGGA